MRNDIRRKTEKIAGDARPVANGARKSIELHAEKNIVSGNRAERAEHGRSEADLYLFRRFGGLSVGTSLHAEKAGLREDEKRRKLFAEKGLTKRGKCDIIMFANRERDAKILRRNAGVAELADARDLKSRDTEVSYRFDPGHRHHRDSKTPSGRAGNIAE